MTPRFLRFTMALALGTASGVGCARNSGESRSRTEPRANEILPPSAGPSCFCDPPNAAYQGRASCLPAALDAGCRTVYTPGGPLPPPDLAA